MSEHNVNCNSFMQVDQSYRGGEIQLIGKGRFKQTVQMGHSKKEKINQRKFNIEGMKKLQVTRPFCKFSSFGYNKILNCKMLVVYLGCTVLSFGVRVLSLAISSP